MALPAAIAAMIVLAGLAVLANIAATAAIRESGALRDVAAERAQRATLRARAVYHLGRRSRSELLAGRAAIGTVDTTLAVSALTWPWHTLTVTAGGMPVFAELARASVPFVPWCNAVVYAAVADIGAGTLNPALSCPDRAQVSPQSALSFDSALVADLIGLGSADTLTVSGSVWGVVRATRAVFLASGANVDGLVVAPIVRIPGGTTVRGLVVARDSLRVAPGASVTADFNAVLAALSARSRLVLVGRRGLLLPQ